MNRRFRQCVGLAGVPAAVVLAAGLVMTASVEAQNYTPAAGTSPASASGSSPVMPDGKPDLNGYWATPYQLSINSNAGVLRKLDTDVKTDEHGNTSTLIATSRRCAPTQKGPDGTGCYENTNQNADGEFTLRLDPNRPQYKPEYWDKVQQLDYDTNNTDPMLRCLPLGVPRMGPPTKIVQTANEMIFLYALNQMNEVRVIPTDGRGHDPERAQDISFYGDAVGHWEGDTLVVDSVGFNDTTWLDIQYAATGYFHSEKLHVIERFRREGNSLHYQATVEDPEVLLAPWVMPPQELGLNPNSTATVHEGDLCRDYDSGIVVSRIRH